MSYSSVDNVKALFRNLNGGSTPAVTDLEIQDTLDDLSAIIDAKIGTLYSLPITSVGNPLSFKILKKIESYLAASDIDDILNSYGEADKKPMWGKKGMELLKALVPDINSKGVQPKPTMILPDASYLGTIAQKSQIKMSAVSGTTFKKGANNW